MPTSKNVSVLVGATSGTIPKNLTRVIIDPVGIDDTAGQNLYRAQRDDQVGVDDTMTRSVSSTRAIARPVGITDFAGATLTQPNAAWDGLLYGTSQIAFDQLNSEPEIAGQLHVRRLYLGGFTSAPGTEENKDFNRGVIPFVSFSSPSVASVLNGSQDALLAQYFGNSTKKKLVTWIHEVDNNKATASEYRAASARMYDIKQANCPVPDKVLLGPIFTGSAYLGTNPEFLTFITVGKLDFLGTDPYNFWRPPFSPDLSTPTPMNDPKCGGGNCNDRSLQLIMQNAATWAEANGNIPFAIGEYGTHPDPGNTAKRPNWLQAADGFMRAHNYIAACYFHSPKGASGPWWLDRFHNFVLDENSADRYLGGRDTASLVKYATFL